jgi:hypothetical protein
MRPAARQLRPARDNLAGAHSETPEINGRDLAALLEQRGDRVPGVRVGPPFVAVPFLFFRPARHGNSQMFPRAYLPNYDQYLTVPQMNVAVP